MASRPCGQALHQLRQRVRVEVAPVAAGDGAFGALDVLRVQATQDVDRLVLLHHVVDRHRDQHAGLAWRPHIAAVLVRLARFLHLVQAVQRTDVGADQRAHHRPDRPGNRNGRAADHGPGHSAGGATLHHALVAFLGAGGLVMVAAQLVHIVLSRRVDVKRADT
ncbi:conserved hypothetical protein [Ricinus communis]|uniref:Uncharacterized protein n=1 Tax=Ricinus communis TaxID=3988 RepID=B9TAZ0_RICCO|nr:conserved hypothetical protein [Ricinus communis]